MSLEDEKLLSRYYFNKKQMRRKKCAVMKSIRKFFRTVHGWEGIEVL